MVTLRMEIFGDTVIERKLVRFSDNARDLRPAWGQIHAEFMKAEREQFNSEGQSGSGGWEALKPATIAQKARKGRSERILVSTGHLFSSLATIGPDHVYRAEPNSLFVGTSVPYAEFHQKGTKGRGRSSRAFQDGQLTEDEYAARRKHHDESSGNAGVPRRRVVEPTEEQRQDWVRILQAHLVKR